VSSCLLMGAAAISSHAAMPMRWFVAVAWPASLSATAVASGARARPVGGGGGDPVWPAWLRQVCSAIGARLTVDSQSTERKLVAMEVLANERAGVDRWYTHGAFTVERFPSWAHPVRHTPSIRAPRIAKVGLGCCLGPSTGESIIEIDAPHPPARRRSLGWLAADPNGPRFSTENQAWHWPKEGHPIAFFLVRHIELDQ